MHQEDRVLYANGDSDDEGVASIRHRQRRGVVESEDEGEELGSSEEDSCSDEEDEISGEDVSDEEDDGEEEEDISGEDFSNDEHVSDSASSDDSDCEDEEEASDEETSMVALEGPSPDSTAVVVVGESSGEEEETCAICLGHMRGEIGSPEGCDHCFCLECILEWSKTNNTCPQDRLQFLLVFARKRVGGRIFKRIPINEAKPEDIPEEEEEPTFCELCGRCDREDRLLLCDGCDLGFHLECLTPPLSTVPIDQWFCPECQALNASQAATEAEIEAGELDALIEDSAISSTAPLNARRRTGRLLPRTRASERVRAIIHRSRQQRINRPIPEELLQDEVENEPVDATPGTSRSQSTQRTGPPARKRRKTVRRKRKVKRKRKTTTTKKSTSTKVKTKVKTTTKTTSATKVKKRKTRKVTKRRRRKVRRKRKRKTTKKTCKIPKPALTPKARIAETLGIRPIKPWQLTPDMRGSSVSSSIVRDRMRSSLPRLTLLGTNSELDYNSEPDEYGDAILAAGVRRRTVASTQALARRKGLSARAMLSHAPLVQSRKRKLVEFNNNNTTSGGVGILDDIIQNQSILHSSRIEIGRDRQLIKRTARGDRTVSQEPSDVVNGVPSSNNNNNNNNSNSSETNNRDTTLQQGVQSGNAGSVSMSSGAIRNSRSSSSNYSRGDGDPTGAKAYSSYLQHSSPEDSGGIKHNKKNNSKNKGNNSEDEDVDIYSDIEPDLPEEEEEEENKNDHNSDEPQYKPSEEGHGGADTSRSYQEEDTGRASSDDEDLVIDDTAQTEGRVPTQVLPHAREVEDNVVGSSNLSNLNDFDLEAVSDTDTHDMDKSMNSSISLSDSNNGDHEVTSSTTDKLHRDDTNKLVEEIFGSDDDHKRSRGSRPAGLGLESLEMETISDNEEIGFDENEDNMEEGEIPGDRPRLQQPLAFNRSKISIQLPRAIAVSPPPAFDGEYEEGEIVDETAKREKKRKEKIRKDKESFQEMLEETKAEEEGESSAVAAAAAAAQIINKEVNHIMEHGTAAAPVVSVTVPPIQEEQISPVKETTPPPPPEKKKQSDKEKSNKPKDKKDRDNKDVSFKKVSKNTKERNYRDTGKDTRGRDGRRSGRSRERSSKDRERGHGRERRSRDRRRSGSGRRRDRDRDRDDRKKEPKRKELERYDVRKMINKKEEERKKKDEFGRDVALRELRTTRSRSRQRRRSQSSKSPQGRRKRSGSRSTSRSQIRRKGGRRRRSYSSSSSSSTSTTSTSSSYTSSSSSTSRSPSRSRGRGKVIRKARSNKSRSRSPPKKKLVKKLPPKGKEKGKEKNTKKPEMSVDRRKDGKKGKDEKRRDGPSDRRGQDGKGSVSGEKRKKRREKSPLQSKEVYQAGGSIMVSVNFSRKEKRKERSDPPPKPPLVPPPPKRRKEGLDGNQMVRSTSFRSWSRSRSGSPSGKRTPLQDEPMWSPGHRIAGEEGAKTPEVIDLDIIMLTPPAQEPILISDSEEEEAPPGITRLPPDLGAVAPSPSMRTQGGGPKTPPEPGVKFTLSTKQVLKPITNPLRDEEEEERPTVTTRGPNTPPGPPPESDESIGRNKSPPPVRLPHSPAGTPPASSPEPDVYDPFEPTKTPSPPRSPQQEPRVSSSDQTEPIEKSPHPPENQVKSKTVPSTPPPLPTEPPSPEERPPEPQKPPPPEEEASSTVPAVTPVKTTPTSKSKPTGAPPAPAVVQAAPPPVITAIPVTTAPLPVIPTATQATPANQMHQLFAGLPTNVANILYPAAIAAAVRSASNPMFRPSQAGLQTVMQPDFSRPPPGMNRMPSNLGSGNKMSDKTKATQNGQNDIVVDMDLDSPNSPDSSDVSDMFEPPSPQPHSGEKSNQTKKSRSHKSSKQSANKPGNDKFDSLFGGSRSHSKRGIHKSARSSKLNKSHKSKEKPSKKFEDDEIPNSAVDLQVKDKYLKKVQRQERVVDEVKLSLKPFYNKKTITKTEYKEIMRKCVQKVCHNKTGEINPTKIRSLVEGYIKKVKYYHKKQLGLGVSNSTSTSAPLFPTVNNPPAPGSLLLAKGSLPPMPIKSKA